MTEDNVAPQSTLSLFRDNEGFEYYVQSHKLNDFQTKIKDAGRTADEMERVVINGEAVVRPMMDFNQHQEEVVQIRAAGGTIEDGTPYIDYMSGEPRVAYRNEDEDLYQRNLREDMKRQEAWNNLHFQKTFGLTVEENAALAQDYTEQNKKTVTDHLIDIPVNIGKETARVVWDAVTGLVFGLSNLVNTAGYYVTGAGYTGASKWFEDNLRSSNYLRREAQKVSDELNTAKNLTGGWRTAYDITHGISTFATSMLVMSGANNMLSSAGSGASALAAAPEKTSLATKVGTGLKEAFSAQYAPTMVMGGAEAFGNVQSAALDSGASMGEASLAASGAGLFAAATTALSYKLGSTFAGGTGTGSAAVNRQVEAIARQEITKQGVKGMLRHPELFSMLPEKAGRVFARALQGATTEATLEGANTFIQMQSMQNVGVPLTEEDKYEAVAASMLFAFAASSMSEAFTIYANRNHLFSARKAYLQERTQRAAEARQQITQGGATSGPTLINDGRPGGVRVVEPNGSVRFADGTTVHPDGTATIVSGEVVDANGSLITKGPATNNPARETLDLFALLKGGDARVFNLPIDDLVVNDRIKQFKSDGDASTGVVEALQGQFITIPAKPILVMEFNDGHKEVVTGRHRLDLAKRNGMTVLPMNVIREKDGWTIDLAKTMDALDNILDSQGSDKDFVDFFRNSRISDAELSQHPEFISRPRQKMAHTVARYAIEDVYSYVSARHDRLTLDVAAAIAQNAPMGKTRWSENVQRACIRGVLDDGMRADEVAIYARGLMQMYSDRALSSQMAQLDLFGEDSSFDLSMRLQSKYASRKVSEINVDLNSFKKITDRRLGSNITARQTLLDKYNIKRADDAEAINRVIAELEALKKGWQNYYLDKNLAAEAKAYADREMHITPVVIETEDGQITTLDRANNDLRVGDEAIRQSEIEDAVNYGLSDDATDSLFSEFEDYTLREPSPQESFNEVVAVRQQYEGTPQWMKAPNGKPTNLNERQWLHTRTQSFKNYFGDWENDPANASKVVDANGEPLVVYHGTNAKNITEFSRDKMGSGGAKKNKGVNLYGDGFYFAKDYYTAQQYGKNVIEVFLNIRNPAPNDLMLTPDNDGIEGSVPGSKIYVTFDPEQAKSATDNVGTYNREDADILREPIVTMPRGRGYDGYSMSVNARLAYDRGEKPLSKWTKSSFVDAIKEINPNISVSRLNVETLRKDFLTHTGWHHTSKQYNITNFYGINEDYVKSLTQEDVNAIEIVKPKRQNKLEKAIAKKEVKINPDLQRRAARNIVEGYIFRETKKGENLSRVLQEANDYIRSNKAYPTLLSGSDAEVKSVLDDLENQANPLLQMIASIARSNDAKKWAKMSHAQTDGYREMKSIFGDTGDTREFDVVRETQGFDAYATAHHLPTKAKKTMTRQAKAARVFAAETEAMWAKALEMNAPEDMRAAFDTPEANEGGYPTISRVIAENYKRPMSFSASVRGLRVKSSKDVASMMMAVRSPYQEMMKAVYLDDKNRVLDAQIISVGALNHTTLNPRAIIGGIPENATSVVISHNHPSGHVTPSDADIRSTQSVMNVLKTTGLELQDHIITNGTKYYSFHDEKVYDIPEQERVKALWEITPNRGDTIVRASQMVRIADFLRQDGTKAGIFYLDSARQIVGVRLLPKELFDMKANATDRVRAVVSYSAIEAANRMIICAPFAVESKVLQPLVDALNGSEMSLMDFIQIGAKDDARPDLDFISMRARNTLPMTRSAVNAKWDDMMLAKTPWQRDAGFNEDLTLREPTFENGVRTGNFTDLPTPATGNQNVDFFADGKKKDIDYRVVESSEDSATDGTLFTAPGVSGVVVKATDGVVELAGIDKAESQAAVAAVLDDFASKNVFIQVDRESWAALSKNGRDALLEHNAKVAQDPRSRTEEDASVYNSEYENSVLAATVLEQSTIDRDVLANASTLALPRSTLEIALYPNGARVPVTGSPAANASRVPLALHHVVSLYRQLSGGQTPSIVAARNKGSKKALGWYHIPSQNVAIRGQLFGLLDASDVAIVHDSLRRHGLFRNEDPLWCATNSKQRQRDEKRISQAKEAKALNALIDKRIESGRHTGVGTKIMAHELWHLIDSMDGVDARNHGNLLGHIANLKESFSNALPVGNFATNRKLMDEARNFIQWWRGTPAPEKYYDKPEEAYAEMGAAMLLDPGAVEVMAPNYYASMLEGLKEHPKAFDAWNQITQSIINGTDLDETLKTLQATWNATSEAEVRKTRDVLTKEGTHVKMDAVRIFLDRYAPLVMVVQDSQKAMRAKLDRALADGNITDAQYRNALSQLEGQILDAQYQRALYTHQYGQSKIFLADLNEKVLNEARRLNVTMADLNTYLHLKRVIEIRDKATAHGIDAPTAKSMLDRMEKQVGVEQMQKVVSLAQTFRSLYEQAVINNPDVREMLGPKTIAMMEKNKHYITMTHTVDQATIDAINEKRTNYKTDKKQKTSPLDVALQDIRGLTVNGGKGGVGYTLRKLEGSFRATKSPILATAQTAVSILEAAQRNHALVELSKVLAKNKYEEFKILDTNESKSENERFGIIEFMEAGEKKAMRVPKPVAAAINADAQTVPVLTHLNRIINASFTTNSFSFAFNAYMRDISSLSINNKGLHRSVLHYASIFNAGSALAPLSMVPGLRRVSAPAMAALNVGSYASFAAQFIPPHIMKRIGQNPIGRLLFNENTVEYWSSYGHKCAKIIQTMDFEGTLREAADARAKGNDAKANELEYCATMARHALEDGVLLTMNQLRRDDYKRSDLGRLFDKYNLKYQDDEALSPLSEKAHKALKRWREHPGKQTLEAAKSAVMGYWNSAGYVAEREAMTIKLAGYCAFHHKQGAGGFAADLNTRRDIALQTIDAAGDPDFTRRGMLATFVEMAFSPFWNARKEGFARSYRAARKHPVNWTSKMLLEGALPKLMSLMVSSGVLGALLLKALTKSGKPEELEGTYAGDVYDYLEWQRNAMRNISPYTLDNYRTVPIWMSEDGSETFSLKTPVPVESQAVEMAVAALWNKAGLSTNAPATNMDDALSNFLRNFYPDLESSGSAIQFARPFLGLVMGDNPYETYRRANMFTDEEFKARWLRPNAWVTASKISWNNSPLVNVSRLRITGRQGELSKDSQTLKQILELPGLGPILSRFGSLDSKGVEQTTRQYVEMDKAIQAARALDSDKIVEDYLENGTLPDEVFNDRLLFDRVMRDVKRTDKQMNTPKLKKLFDLGKQIKDEELRAKQQKHIFDTPKYTK